MFFLNFGEIEKTLESSRETWTIFSDSAADLYTATFFCCFFQFKLPLCLCPSEQNFSLAFVCCFLCFLFGWSLGLSCKLSEREFRETPEPKHKQIVYQVFWWVLLAWQAVNWPERVKKIAVGTERYSWEWECACCGFGCFLRCMCKSCGCVCVCVSICGCKVGWFAGACLWLQCARKGWWGMES